MIDICILTKPRFIQDITNAIEWYLLNADSLNLRTITVYCNFPFEYTYPNKKVIIKRALPYSNFHRQKEIYMEYLSSRIPQENDYIIFLDDDEYLFYDDKVFNVPLDILLKKFNRNLYKIPEIFMSTDILMYDRKDCTNIIDFCRFRRDEKSSQAKSIIKYSKDFTYDFNTVMKDNHIPLHTPSINGKFNTSILYGSDIKIYDDMSSYAEIEYDFPLRLYHYHIKTLADWNFKIKRGSAASEVPWYKESVFDNIFFGNYTIKDNTIYEDYIRRKENMSKHY